MATPVVDPELCSVITFPRAKKRGRKVTKGPKATVTVIHESSDPITALTGPIRSVKEEESRLTVLLRDRANRLLEERAQQEAWIEMSANVRRWPISARYRSEELVHILKKGGEDEEPILDPEIAEMRQSFQRDIAARRDEILAEAGHSAK